MALSSYTFAKLKHAAERAVSVKTLGSDGKAVRSIQLQNSSADIVNDSISYLADCHPWSWRRRSLTLDTVNNQKYVALPADFAQLESLHRVNPVADAIPISLDKIIAYRSGLFGYINPTLGYFYALSTLPQASVTALPVRILELYPTPQADETGALIGSYLRQIPALVNDTDCPDIPANYHVALMVLVRAFAALEEVGSGDNWTLFNNMLVQFQQSDGGAAGNLGKLDGGVSEWENQDIYRLYPSNISQG